MKHFSIITLVLDYHIGIAMSNDKWLPVIVSNATLNGSGNISNKFSNSLSDTVCAMMASRVPWANLFCFDDDRVCRISSFKAAPYESVTPISDPVECMTKLGDGCNYNNSFFSVGKFLEVNDTPICSLLWCQNGGMMTPKAPLNTFPGSCSAPFTQTAYGCYYANNTSRKFCDTRKFCLSVGGDLWTNLYLSSLELFNQALTPSGCWGCFIGMYGTGPNMYWINGSVATSTYLAVKHPNVANPPFATYQCVAHAYEVTQYWQPDPCTETMRPTFCEKTIF